MKDLVKEDGIDPYDREAYLGAHDDDMGWTSGPVAECDTAKDCRFNVGISPPRSMIHSGTVQ